MVMDRMMSHRIQEVLGRRLVVSLEWEGVLADSPSGDRLVPLDVIIEDVLVSRDGYPNFVVRLARPLTLDVDFVVERMLVVGIDMNLIDELFGTPRRPVGLPVLVGMWRLKDNSEIHRIRETKKPPPSQECIGRGEVSMA